MKSVTVTGLVWFLFYGLHGAFAQEAPPYTDYCAMLARDIQGKKPPFMAGDKMLYMGGQANYTWNITENEHIGLTHSFFFDGRSRGQGIYTTANTGTGHDFMGWEFYRNVRAAYGRVKVGSTWYDPSPVEMIWRPDRVYCRYLAGGATIEEYKFFSMGDVACSIITANQAATLEISGKSYSSGDSVTKTASSSYDSIHNAVHIVEGGTINCRPEGSTVVGKLMYDGMHTVVACSKDISGSYTLYDSGGDKWYKFEVPLDSNGLAIAHGMDDSYSNVISRVDNLMSDYDQALQKKTDFMNGLLNYQIPYFRCSSERAVDTYYYIWALYFMYHRSGVPGTYTEYPHCVTAVNNFQSPFAFDHWVYTNMAPWVVDKDSWGYGNSRIWTKMKPYKIGLGVPETFGTTWRSGNVPQTVLGHVVGAWRMYEHSNNIAYLSEVYDLYRDLYWNEVPHEYGAGIKVADCLIKMADALGLSADKAHWQAAKAGRQSTFEGDWERYEEHWYGDATVKDVWALTCLWNDYIGHDRAQEISDYWVMNDTEGFLGEVPLKIRAFDSPQIPPFNVNTINTWLAADGMFENHVDSEAAFITLKHIDGMNRDYGFPVTPECWDQNNKPWGDMYYLWDAPVTLLIIEDLCGIDYSVINGTFTICEHTPNDWGFLETYVPIRPEGAAETQWTRLRIDRVQNGEQTTKTLVVEGNSLTNLNIQPWLEERQLVSAEPAGYGYGPIGHVNYSFTGEESKTITLVLGGAPEPTPTPTFEPPTGELVAYYELNE